MFASLPKPEDNAMGNAPLEQNKIDLEVDEVIKLDREQKTIATKAGKKFFYEKVILATGSNPIMPPVKGLDKAGVYPILKEMGYLKELKEKLSKAKNAVIIGGGFIGIEFADEFSAIRGLKVSLVELLPHLLLNSFDPEFGQMVEEKIKAKGVNLVLGKKVVEAVGDKSVTGIKLDDGNVIPAALVVLGIGARPSSELAKQAGLTLGRGGGICVDEYMRTLDPAVFAIGDCAEKKDFFTRRDLPVMLAMNSMKSSGNSM